MLAGASAVSTGFCGCGESSSRATTDSAWATRSASSFASSSSSPFSTSMMYAVTTRLGSPSPWFRPLSSHSAWSQKCSTRFSEWVTSRMVLLRRRNSANLSRHFTVKPWSPTASTSSTSSTSGSTWIATANPSRMYMPEE